MLLALPDCRSIADFREFFDIFICARKRSADKLWRGAGDSGPSGSRDCYFRTQLESSNTERKKLQ